MSSLTRLLIFIPMLVSLVSSSLFYHFERSKRDTATCSITEEELQVMRMSIIEIYSLVSAKKVQGCNPLITETTTCANDLKSFVSRKLEESDTEYNKTLNLLQKKERKLLAKLEMIPQETQSKYLAKINNISAVLEILSQRIDEQKIEKEKYEADLDYYTDYLNNGTKFSLRSDFDSFFEKAKQCSFRRDSVGKLITVFNEIFVLIVGNPRNSPQSDCFEELRHQMTSIDNIITHRTGENKIESLRSTYAERSRCLQKLIDDYTLQHQQQANIDYTNFRDKLQSLKQELTMIRSDTEKLRKKTIAAGVATIKRMIRGGEKYRKAREILIKIRKELKDSYKKVLDKTYNCEPDHLQATIQFAEIFDKYQGLKIIGEKMKECDQLTSPFILKIAFVTKNKDFDEELEKVYQGWSAQIRQNQSGQIETFMNIFDSKIMNFPRLFQQMLAQDVRNARNILQFIDQLHAYDQNIATILYDEIARNYVNSIEHIKIAEWIRDKLNWIEMQPSHTVLTGDLQPYLERLRKGFQKWSEFSLSSLH